MPSAPTTVPSFRRRSRPCSAPPSLRRRRSRGRCRASDRCRASRCRGGRPAAPCATARPVRRRRPATSAAATSDTVMTTTKAPICTGTLKPKIRRGRGGDGAGADEGRAEVRNGHFEDGGDEAPAQPGQRRDCAAHVENSSRGCQDHRRGTADGRPAVPARECQQRSAMVARPKQINSRVRLASGVVAFRASTRPDVRQNDRADHRRDVFDGPEAQRRIFHRAAEVVQDRPMFGLSAR